MSNDKFSYEVVAPADLVNKNRYGYRVQPVYGRPDLLRINNLCIVEAFSLQREIASLGGRATVGTAASTPEHPVLD